MVAATPAWAHANAANRLEFLKAGPRRMAAKAAAGDSESMRLTQRLTVSLRHHHHLENFQ